MPEKTINEMPAELRKLFTRGNDALARENYDYAIDLYNQVLDGDPSFYECRKALRNAQIAKSGERGGFFKKAFSGAKSSPLMVKAQAVIRSNPAEALSIGEQILNTDAYSPSGHNIIVDAATALEMPRTAVMSLEVLAKNSPRDKKIVVQYGQALADIGETSRAEKVLMEYCRAMPNDQEAMQVLKDLSARDTMKSGGYDAVSTGKASFRDMLKDKGEATRLEQENRVQKTEDTTERLIREYETRLQTEPNNARLIRSLAEMYTQRKEFDKALATYDRVKGTDLGGDSSLDQAMTDTMVKKFDHQIEQLDQQNPDYPQHLARLNSEKLAYQVAECQKRVERFPTDLAIWYQMGQLYFQAGKIGEAIQELQKAQGNPNKRLAAMGLLAQCFAKRKMYDIAARTLQSAIKEKPVMDDEKKDLIYNLGSVLETMGKKEEAIEQFKIIYEMDIGYRDISAKVDAYYAGQ